LRWLFRVVLLMVAGVVMFDVTRPPAQQVSARFAVAAVHVYQARLSPLLGSAGIACRFTPTCSRYAEAVIARDGLVRGSWLAAKRIVRCGPWTAMGTTDPP
jgi:putative membrane protein insertion efficiency factor